MRIDTVLFDLDGTLVDTGPGVLESVRYAAAAFGCPELEQETLMKFIGPPLLDSFPRYYGLSKADTLEAIRLFREHYTAGAMFHARPYNGMLSLCRTLREEGFLLAVATNKAEGMARKLLASFGFDRYCSPIHGADLEGRLSKADIIRLCLQELGKAPESAVLVGDTVHDAEGARIAGVRLLAVTWGFGFRAAEDAQAYRPVGVADRPETALALLRALNAGV